MYIAIKHIHLTAVAVSFLFFTFRYLLRLTNSHLLQKKWMKITPHIVDTLLLASAIVLMFVIGQYPLVNAWLTAKLVCVVGYILMGVACLKISNRKSVITGAYLIALAFIACAGKIAVTKQVPFF
jgi:uncharacterized membrane protein SirB2